MKAFLNLSAKIIELDITYYDTEEVLLILCEHVLGLAGNCKHKDKFIDGILQLDEEKQAILMEVMVKYIPQKDTKDQLIQELQSQLKEKEVEHIALLRDIKNLSKANDELLVRINKAENIQFATAEENVKLKKEIEALYVSTLGGEFIEREKELEAYIKNGQKEIKELKKKLKEQEEENVKEISRKEEEVYVLNEKLKRMLVLESSNIQLKKSVQELMEREDMLKNEMLELRKRIEKSDKEKEELEVKSTELIKQNTINRNKLIHVESKLNKALEDHIKLETNNKKLNDNTLICKQRLNDSEETIKKLQEEVDSYKLISATGCLLTQEKEAKYETEIHKLKQQISMLVNNTEEQFKVRVLELENKVDSLLLEKERLVQELVLKKENVKLSNEETNSKEITRVNNLLKQSEDEKANLLVKIKELSDNNSLTEKKLMRVQEDINKLILDKNRYESAVENRIKQVTKCKKQVQVKVEQRVRDHITTEINEIEKKYKNKIKTLKNNINKLQESIIKEKENSKKGIREIARASKRTEQQIITNIKSILQDMDTQQIINKLIAYLNSI